MLTNFEIESFEKNGYLLIPNILDAQQVAHMRDRISTIFSTDEWKKSAFNTNRVLAEIYNDFPEFTEIVLNEKVIEILRQLLETTPVLMPESAIHFQFYTGWHKDTTDLEKKGKSFHFKPDCKLIQAGFYLQDNTPEYGGGLTVMPGSHLTPDNFVSKKEEAGLGTKIKWKLGLYKESKDSSINPHDHSIVDIPSKAGDFVLFNMRTSHRATFPANNDTANVPFDLSKIAIFNAFTRDNESSLEYGKYLSEREEPFYQNLKTKKNSPSLLNQSDTLNFKVV